MSKEYIRRRATRAEMWNGANLKKIMNFVGVRYKYAKGRNDELIFELGCNDFLVIQIGGFVVRENDRLFSMSYDKFNETYQVKRG